MELTWYNTASLVLKEEGTTIAFDPFCPLSAGRMASPDALRRMKDMYSAIPYVFVTHGHLDHIYYIPYFYKDTSAKIYCTNAPCRTLLKRGIPAENLCRIEPGTAFDIGPFTIRTWKGRHCIFDAPLLCDRILCRRFWRHPVHLLHMIFIYFHHLEKGETLFYEVSSRNIRIQILGSLNLDENTIYPTGADILILPFQGRSDINTYARKFIERLKPKSILLDHYDDTFPPFTYAVDTAAFADKIQNDFKIPCCPLKCGKTLVLKAGNDSSDKNTIQSTSHPREDKN